MESKLYVCKYFVVNKTLYAKVDWKDNETDLFHIKIYDAEDCWVGRFSREFAEKYRERVDESIEEYSKNVKAGVVDCSKQFTYNFAPNIDNNYSAAFSWTKTFEDGTAIIHGSVPVHREASSKDTVIDLLLEQNMNLKHMIEKYDMTMQMLKSELEQSKTDLAKFLNVKMSLESSVYSKFVTLLNGKKRRIQLLEHNLQALDNPMHIENDVD